MYEELGYMGQYARRQSSRVITLHRVINDLFGLPSRPAFPPGAVIVQQKRIPDVSFWQGTINFYDMRQKTDAAIFRGGQNLWIDSQFKRSWAEAKRVGIKRGSYWFYDDRVSPGKQADLWASLLKDDMPEMEIWADWENTYGGAYGGLPNVVAFMQRVEQLLPGIKIGLYTGYYFFRGHSNAVTNASQYNYLKTRPLFEAWYTSNAANVLIPNPWTSIFLWQFGTPAVGREYGAQSAEIDMSFINMTEAEFQQRYGGEIPPPVEEPVDYYEIKRNSGTDYRSIRQGPDIRTALLYKLLPGQIAKAGVTVDDVYVYQNDIPNGSGGYWARAGDMWRKVYEHNGARVTGWIAKVHLGRTYITERLVTVTEPPPVGGTAFTLSVSGYKPYSGELEKA